jgi:hypothetical protein
MIPTARCEICSVGFVLEYVSEMEAAELAARGLSFAEGESRKV